MSNEATSSGQKQIEITANMGKAGTKMFNEFIEGMEGSSSIAKWKDSVRLWVLMARSACREELFMI